eukprot:GFUD01040661.1.p1 GENE.GFUD01040661.1~~GFUD01040661.1.p1  ORF type:complete len:242 (+),score=29.95 GFUD01040661.1:381-1106(+)
MVSVKVIGLISVLASMILPTRNQLFVNTDKPDWDEMYNNHFANPVIQWRSFIGILVQWVASFAAWVLLGAVWAQIRGDQYDYNLNTTVLFNYVVSDTKATQNTIKAVSFGALSIIIFQKLASKGSPIPVPQKVDILRGRREAGWKDGWETKEDKILRTSNVYSDQTSQNLKYSKESDPEDVPHNWVKIHSHSHYQTFPEILIDALNQNLEPNGIGRIFFLNTVMATAQFIFWLACTLLPRF